MNQSLDKIRLAKLIDHTLLKPEATKEQIVKLCDEAIQFGFLSVCVNPMWVRLCRERLRASQVLVATVVGFPLGTNTTETKAFEAKKAIEDRATEIDMVMNIGWLKSNEFDLVEKDIRAVVEAVGKKGLVKVILETCFLTQEEKTKGALLAKNAGAHFVKTSTGFAERGATVEDVALLRKIVGREMGVKAAGGIRDYQTAVEMIEAGANRIGASSSVAIIQEAPEPAIRNR